MGLTVSSSGGDFKHAPAGTHVARCIRLIDIGTQHGEYQGTPNVRHQIIMMFELPNEMTDEGKPYVVSRFYTASLGKKATLRHDLEQWRGRAFNESELMAFKLPALLGKLCMLSIVEKDGGGTKIGGVMAAPKGTTATAAVNEPYYFDMDEWDQKRFDAFTDGIKNLIQKSDEYKARMAPKKIADDLDDDPPFDDMPPADDSDSIPF
jgi:hypothetical protein